MYKNYERTIDMLCMFAALAVAILSAADGSWFDVVIYSALALLISAVSNKSDAKYASHALLSKPTIGRWFFTLFVGLSLLLFAQCALRAEFSRSFSFALIIAFSIFLRLKIEPEKT